VKMEMSVSAIRYHIELGELLSACPGLWYLRSGLVSCCTAVLEATVQLRIISPAHNAPVFPSHCSMKKLSFLTRYTETGFVCLPRQKKLRATNKTRWCFFELVESRATPDKVCPMSTSDVLQCACCRG
jgi:hypothetical protein